jgi:hypothetical protein
MSTPNMLLDLPTLGGDPSVWDDKLNAAMTLVDSHDHTTNKGVKIGAAGLNILTDVTFNGTAALTNLKACVFAAQGVPTPTTNKSLFVKSADNELYWRTNAGVDVKITAGSSLNLALVGGIFGDYSSTSAKVYYEDAGKRYKMLQSGPAPDFWAAVDCGDLKLYEKASGIVNAVTQKSPAALGAAYTITWPSAVPGAAALLQSSTVGALSFNATGNRLGAFFTTLDCNNTVTLSGTVNLGTLVAAFTSTGKITATDFAHSTAQKLILGAALWAVTGAPAALDATGSKIALSTHTGATTTPTAVCSIPLKNGDRITQINVNLDKNSGAGTVRARLKSYTVSSSATTDVANAAWTAGQVISLTGLALDLNAGTEYWIQIEGGGTTNDFVYTADIWFIRP